MLKSTWSHKRLQAAKAPPSVLASFLIAVIISYWQCHLLREKGLTVTHGSRYSPSQWGTVGKSRQEPAAADQEDSKEHMLKWKKHFRMQVWARHLSAGFQSTQEIRPTADKWGLIKWKGFCTLKETVYQGKRQLTQWEKVFTGHTADKELTSRICKRLKN